MCKKQNVKIEVEVAEVPNDILIFADVVLADEQWDQPGERESQWKSAQKQLEPGMQQLVSIIQQLNEVQYSDSNVVVNNTWNIMLLEGLLSEYEDREILHYLQCGWPIERDMSVPLE